MRGGGMGVSEVGSEFCRGIGGRWGDRLSWKAETPWEDWSCRDCEPVIEEPWDFTETKWAIWTTKHQTCVHNPYTKSGLWLIRTYRLILNNSSCDSGAEVPSWRLEQVWGLDGTWGSTGRCMGGVRACWMPPLLKDSERGGSDGSEIRLATLCCRAGELCRFSLERSSTWRTEESQVQHGHFPEAKLTPEAA